MQIKSKPMGPYQTNCYIASENGVDIIIDPGVDAFEWVTANVTNPVAVLNTHGHFDHVWSNQQVKEHFNIPLYTPKGDVMLLGKSNWMPGLPPSTPDVEVEGDQCFELGGMTVKFLHFPGHCPGCSMIEIGDAVFSGDFIFRNSIGRVDFPYSSPEQMRQSLKRFLKINTDKKLYPGHGLPTTISAEQQNVPYWLNAI